MNRIISRASFLAGARATVQLGFLGSLFKSGSAQAQVPDDSVSLNALLTAEFQAIKAYAAGGAYLQSPSPGDPGAAAAPVVLAVALHFQSQHRDHANKLTELINSGGGQPIREDAVPYSLPAQFRASVQNVIQLAANAEKSAALAYGYLLKLLTQQKTAEVAAAIGGVETQHFIVLYLLAKGIAQATPNTQALVNDVVPRSFVGNVVSGAGLESVPDFQFAP